MNTTFDRMYRQLARVTFGVLIGALAVYAATLICALLGLPQAVTSLGGAAASIAYVFVILLAVFLVASVAAAVVRWIDRRKQA